MVAEFWKAALLALLGLAGLVAVALRRDAVDELRVELSSGTVVLERASVRLPGGTEGRRRRSTTATDDVFLVRVADAPGARKAVEQATGLRLTHRVAPRTYAVGADAEAVAGLESSASVTAFGPLPGHAKLARELELDWESAMTSAAVLLRRRALGWLDADQGSSEPAGDEVRRGIVLTPADGAQLDASRIEADLLAAGEAHWGACPPAVVHLVTTPSRVLGSVHVDAEGARADAVVACLRWASVHLAERPDVLWIAPEARMRMLNREVSPLIQTGRSRASDDSMVLTQGLNLTGAGELIGIADTGIDADNCFFHDPDYGSPLAMHMGNVTGHRKIAGMLSSFEGGEMTAAFDFPNGHGTHVAGTAAGSMHRYHTIDDGLAEYAGVAPGAKLVVYTLVVQDALLSRDAAIYDEILPSQYDLGTRIMSNSWGCDRDVCPEYSTQSYEVDRFVWENPDALVLFAAGNGGTYGRSSLVAPSTNKNGMSIGASQTSTDGFRESMYYTDMEELLLEYNTAYCLAEDAPGYTCCPDCFRTVEDCCGWVKPTRCCAETMQAWFDADPDLWSQIHLAGFSSLGPTSDGRVKPDVVAPGFATVSAHSDGHADSNQCGTTFPTAWNEAALVAKMGTSMATPAVAGAAALVRQYLREDLHGLGSVASPSAALVKAMLVHASRPLTGVMNGALNSWETSLPPETPNFFVGFGGVQLDRVLLADNGGDGRRLHFVDGGAFDEDERLVAGVEQDLGGGDEDEEDNEFRLCVDIAEESARAFVVTLAYSDYPGSPAASGPQLVNDLDLRVERGLRIFRGNDASGGGDDLNNVEQVLLSEPKAGRHAVVVRARNVEHGPQPFALVLTGEFQLVDDVGACDTPYDWQALLAIIVSVVAVIGLVALFVFIYRRRRKRDRELNRQQAAALAVQGPYQPTVAAVPYLPGAPRTVGPQGTPVSGTMHPIADPAMPIPSTAVVVEDPDNLRQPGDPVLFFDPVTDEYFFGPALGAQPAGPPPPLASE